MIFALQQHNISTADGITYDTITYNKFLLFPMKKGAELALGFGSAKS